AGAPDPVRDGGPREHPAVERPGGRAEAQPEGVWDEAGGPGTARLLEDEPALIVDTAARRGLAGAPGCAAREVDELGVEGHVVAVIHAAQTGRPEAEPQHLVAPVRVLPGRRVSV